MNGTGDEVKLKGLLRVIFVHNARVSHIKSFISKILKLIDKNIIKNENFIKLFRHEQIKMHEYEYHNNEDGADNFPLIS